LTCKNRLPYNLYCVGGDVKHCSLTHSSWFVEQVASVVWTPTVWTCHAQQTPS